MLRCKEFESFRNVNYQVSHLDVHLCDLSALAHGIQKAGELHKIQGFVKSHMSLLSKKSSNVYKT